MISNFTPAGLLALNFSAKNWKVLMKLLPTGPIKPVCGSIQAIFTVSFRFTAGGAACASGSAALAARAMPRTKVLVVRVMWISRVKRTARTLMEGAAGDVQ